MVMTVIFILVLLAGISLFVAVVGSAFLKRHSRRVGRPGEFYARSRDTGRSDAGMEGMGVRGTGMEGMSARDMGRSEIRAGDSGGRSYQDYKERFRREFQEKVGAGARGAGNIPAMMETPQREFIFKGPGEPAGVKSSSTWFFITISVLIFVIFAAYFGIKGYKNITARPNLYFCENVDYVKQKPIHKSNTFTRGNVTIFVKSRTPFEQNTARVDIYRIDIKGLEPFAGKELTIKPEWTSFSFKALFDKLGVYSVLVFNADGKLLNQKKIYIVHDSHAYKPVRE